MEHHGYHFSTLEKVCLERAEGAEKEMKYWLAKAEEWRRLKNSYDPFAEGIATQLDCCVELHSGGSGEPEVCRPDKSRASDRLRSSHSRSCRLPIVARGLEK